MSVETEAPASAKSPARKVVGRPFPKGVSGNPGGRPRVEPRIRRRARRYDTLLVRELWKIGSDPKVDPDVRRRALMDLQSIGNGRPPTTQEVVGRPDAPLVAMNFAMQPGQALSPEQAYKLMLEGVLELDPQHPAFNRKALEAPAETASSSAESA